MKKIIAIIIAAAAVYAAGEDAAITYIHGAATVTRSGTTTTAVSGSALRENDRITTADGATVIIALIDGTRVKVNERSTVTLAAVTGGKKNILLTLGSIFAKVKKLGVAEEFTVSTPTVTAAVRGTQFFIGYGTDKGIDTDQWLCVNEGAVAVHAAATKDTAPVTVKQGEGIFIVNGKKITKPKPYAWTKKLNWNMDAAQGTVEDGGALKSAYDILKKHYD
ncbi:MAG: FecR domain-containing protein [Spirochaetes bacterium]|nr:FecR domain-containing protein [Spirochaetota bacterium]